MFSLFGCGKPKYKLIFDNSGFTSGKLKYAQGEQVTVIYEGIATDTRYSFYSDDVDFAEKYEADKGYVLTFTMPEHDVRIGVERQNTMEIDPGALVTSTGEEDGKKEEGTAELVFDSFDGGGPAFEVEVGDEGIVTHEMLVHYKSADHNQMAGAGKDVIIRFQAVNPGVTTALIKERSPIADNLDRKYRITVNEEGKIGIEELCVKNINEGSDEMMLLINDVEVPILWEDNESVAALRELSPLTIKMSMYGGFEQVGAIGQSIPGEDEQMETQYGDVVLYSGNQLVIFYGSNSWAYTKLGHIDLTKEEMTELLGKEAVVVTLQ